MDFMDLIETPRVDNVKFCEAVFSEEQNQIRNQFYDGSLCLTCHHLIFSFSDKQTKEIWVLYSLIDSIEVRKDTINKFQLIIKCKNFQILIIEFASLTSLQSVQRSLESLSNITTENMKVPFFNRESFKAADNGWSLYSVEDDFASFFDKLDSECLWRISEVNKDYSVCLSYPQKLIVPKNVDDTTLLKSSKFRSDGRFPVLSYFHRATKSFVMKCGQPLLGASNKRSKEDETLLKQALPIGKKGVVYDLRDASLMKSAAAKGGGYETDAHYPLWKRVNRHMDRFDQLQVSFAKIVDACCADSSNVDRWLSKLESSGWLTNMRNALHIACCVADEVQNKNACVMVHGWEGKDNTLIITSLVQVLLNPECRTLKGFELLVEREWLQFGHPFSKRCFKSAYGVTQQKLEAPVFLLFLDCVRQLMDQFCLSFEFNETFLILLFDNAYAPQYGTFIGNCERERDDLEVRTRTSSLWSFVNNSENCKTFLNPLFEKNSAIIWPSLFYQSMGVWSGLFLRFSRNERPFSEAKCEIQKLLDADQLARSKVNKLRNELLELQKQALQNSLISMIDKSEK